MQQTESIARVEADDAKPSRLLSFMASPPTEASASFVLWAWRYLVLHLTFRYSLSLLKGEVSATLIACTIASAISLSLAMRGTSLVRWSKLLTLGAAVAEMIMEFPYNSNHSWMECVLILMFVSTNLSEADERDLLVQSGRWLVALVMLHGGLKKILHGTYFNGAYLATQVDDERLGRALRFVLSDAELAKLQQAVRTGSEGPFYFDAPLALVASNAVYLAELLVALLLIYPPARRLGVLLGLVTLVGIEVAALELTFGLLMLNLLMLFAPLHVRVRVALASLVGYGLLAAVQIAIGPGKEVFI